MQVSTAQAGDAVEGSQRPRKHARVVPRESFEGGFARGVGAADAAAEVSLVGAVVEGGCVSKHVDTQMDTTVLGASVPAAEEPAG